MQPVAEALSRVRLGEPAQFQNMAVFPLFAPSNGAPGYLLLGDALERKLAHVTEVSESGSVPELLFANDGEAKVLLVDGEELVGARQNRILNVTLLVGGRQKVVIPVSCVEQGRWAWKSRHFAAADRALFATARAKKAQQVNASLRESRSRYANQAEIWSDISAKAACLRVASGTEAMADIYEQQRGRIEDYVQAFAPRPGQAGAVFAVGGRIAGVELFDSDATFRKFMAKIVRSYAIDAIETAPSRHPGESRDPDDSLPCASRVGGLGRGHLESPQHFIDDIKSAAVQRFPALAEGEDLRIESEGVAGGALCAENRLVRLCAFRVEKSAARPIGRGGSIDFEIPAFLRRRHVIQT